MMKSALVLALVAGTAAADLDLPVRKGWEANVITDRSKMKAVGYEYRAGSERVFLSVDRFDDVALQTDDSVEIWQLNEALFDARGNAACPDTSTLFIYSAPDEPGVAPQYFAVEGTAQFQANTVIDCLTLTHSLIPEPLATQGDGTNDPLIGNEMYVIIEDGENALQEGDEDVLTPDFERWGVIVPDLSGDDAPPTDPGFFNLVLITLDLGAGTTDLRFEVADDNGMAEVDGVPFNANSFKDSTLNFNFADNDTNSLSDTSYTFFFLEPDGNGGQLDPADPNDRTQLFGQGTLFGFSEQFRIADPLDLPGTWPEVDDPTLEPGGALGALNLFRIWDLTVPAPFGGVDVINGNPFDEEFFNEGSSGALFGSGFGLIGPERTADAWPQWVTDNFLSRFDFVCEDFAQPLVNPDNPAETFDVIASATSDPYIGFFGPGAGTPGCHAADLAEPFGILDLADVDAFIPAFLAGEPLADLAEPFGVFDLADVDVFIPAFLGGCPTP